jgi:hypothetical protein
MFPGTIVEDEVAWPVGWALFFKIGCGVGQFFGLGRLVFAVTLAFLASAMDCLSSLTVSLLRFLPLVPVDTARVVYSMTVVSSAAGGWSDGQAGAFLALLVASFFTATVSVLVGVVILVSIMILNSEQLKQQWHVLLAC